MYLISHVISSSAREGGNALDLCNAIERIQFQSLLARAVHLIVLSSSSDIEPSMLSLAAGFENTLEIKLFFSPQM